MIDVEKALVDPGLVFKSPAELLANQDLSRQQKIEILRRWEYDGPRLATWPSPRSSSSDPGTWFPDATARSSGAIPTSSEVLGALRELGAAADTERSAPTKQGGS